MPKHIVNMKIVLLVFAIYVFGLMPVYGNSQIRRLEILYERELQNISSSFQEERLRLPQDYMTALRNLEVRFMQAGDEENVSIIRQVRTQFVLDPTPAGLRAAQAPDALAQLRSQYEEAFREAARSKHEQTEELRRQYRSALSRLQNELQRQGQNEDANRVGRILAALPAEQQAAPRAAAPDVAVDLGRDRAAAPAGRTTPRETSPPAARPAPPTRPPPQTPRAPQASDESDPFDSLLDQWLN